MIQSIKKPVMAITIIIVSTGSMHYAHADTLASYSMILWNINGQQSKTADDTNLVGLNALGITEELTGGTAQHEFGVFNTGLIPGGVNGASARSMNGNPSNPWWSFTLDPDVKKGLLFDTVSLDASVTSTLSGATDWDYDLYWNVDGYTATLGTFDGPYLGASGTETATDLSVNIPHLAEQDSEVTFRIVPRRISGTNGGASQRAGWIDNVVVTGTVTNVPVADGELLYQACLRVVPSGGALSQLIPVDPYASVNKWNGSSGSSPSRIWACATRDDDNSYNWAGDSPRQLRLFMSTCEYLGGKHSVSQMISPNYSYLWQAFCVEGLETIEPVTDVNQ